MTHTTLEPSIPTNYLLFSNDLVRIEQADFCSIPGYLIVRLIPWADSFAALSPAQAAHFGQTLSLATAAIEQAVAADRVYCLSFAEIDRRLHVHLFPRTPALLAAYHQATDTAGQPTNGPLLFEWARTTFAINPVIDPALHATMYPAAHSDKTNPIEAVCQALRYSLAESIGRLSQQALT